MPENALNREVENIKACQNRMRQTLENVNTQLGVNRNARHILERDLQNKDHAIGIDHSCHQVSHIYVYTMMYACCLIGWHYFCTQFDPDISYHIRSISDEQLISQHQHLWGNR